MVKKTMVMFLMIQISLTWLMAVPLMNLMQRKVFKKMLLIDYPSMTLTMMKIRTMSPLAIVLVLPLMLARVLMFPQKYPNVLRENLSKVRKPGVDLCRISLLTSVSSY